MLPAVDALRSRSAAVNLAGAEELAQRDVGDPGPARRSNESSNRVYGVGSDGAPVQNPPPLPYVLLKLLTRLAWKAARPLGEDGPPAAFSASRAWYRNSPRVAGPP